MASPSVTAANAEKRWTARAEAARFSPRPILWPPLLRPPPRVASVVSLPRCAQPDAIVVVVSPLRRCTGTRAGSWEATLPSFITSPSHPSPLPSCTAAVTLTLAAPRLSTAVYSYPQHRLSVMSTFSVLTRPCSDGSIASRTVSPPLSSASSSSCSLPPSPQSSGLSPPQPSSPMSPLQLPNASSPARAASSCCVSSSPTAACTSPSRSSSSSSLSSFSSSPAITHLFPSLAPSFTLSYDKTRFTVHSVVLSHQSPFFHSLLHAQPSLSQYSVPAVEGCSSQHLLLLLQLLYSPLPPVAAPSAATSAGFSFTAQQQQLIPHLHPLLLLSHHLQLPAQLSSLSCLLSLMLRRHLHLHPQPSLTFLLETLLMARTYGLQQVAEVVEAEVVTAGGEWWAGEDWTVVKAELDAELVERMERAGREEGKRRQEVKAAAAAAEDRLRAGRRSAC